VTPASPASGDGVSVIHGADKVAGVVLQRGAQTFTIEFGEALAVQRGAVLAVEWPNDEGIVRAACEVVMHRRLRLVLSQIGPAQLIQRRESPRVSVQLGVEARSFSGRTYGRTVDIAEGGILAELPNLRAGVGEQVDLVVDLPDRSLDVVARVVRIDENGLVALGFTDLRLAAHERLMRLVAQVRRERAA
jgi:c-di-GMP-binding flagellar brake protein YcgR